MNAKHLLALAALAATTLYGPNQGHAQAPDPTRDEALDRLLEKAEETRPERAKPEDKADAKPKDEAPTAGGAKKTEGKGASEVSPKDQALDNLLEGLGQTEDKPAADDAPKGPGGQPPKDAPPEGEGSKPEADPLKGQSKELDEHLEELTGRKHKKKGQNSEGSGPLSQVIKEMREVEQRLGKDDTGEDTRKRQEQIVKNIDSLIEQLRESSSQSQGKRQIQISLKPGQQPGKPGQTPGTTGGNAPYTKPSKPDPRRNLAGDKDVWGHLPPELQQEMMSGQAEESLPDKEDLIRRYFLSISKKSLIREE